MNQEKIEKFITELRKKKIEKENYMSKAEENFIALNSKVDIVRELLDMCINIILIVMIILFIIFIFLGLFIKEYMM